MTHLSLFLLGTFQAKREQEPITGFQSNKVRALLAYLAVEGHQPHQRAKLAGLFWPDWPDPTARTYLRQSLANLNRLLGKSGGQAPFLLATRQTIQFNPESDYWLDFTVWQEAFSHYGDLEQPLTRPDLRRLEQALALYRGDFMAGFFLGGCAAFEEWQLFTREQLQRQVVQALNGLVVAYEQVGDLTRALQYAWQRVELEPWLEGAHRQVMHLLAVTGERGAALAHYEKYRRLLEDELETEPGPETRALYEQIKASPEAPPGQPGGPTVDLTRRGRPTDVQLPVTPSFLSVPSSPPDRQIPFVAREPELGHLKRRLDLALTGQGRIVFVTGEAGCGKTFLLRAFADLAQERDQSLLVASGHCNALTGLGDPYLPFREVFSLLTGDIEARWRTGTMTRANALRLWRAFPLAVSRLVTDGPDLIGSLVHSDPLLARAARYVSRHQPWVRQLGELATHQPKGPDTLSQINLFEQVTTVLQTLAHHYPLLLLFDDLQWADLGSISLLFHLGRRLAGCPILIVGTYRSEEIALGRKGGQHPLAPVVNEFQRDFGPIKIDLNEADGRAFVEALLDAQPNRLDTAFRAQLYQQSSGQALFTVELVRGMQACGDLARDEDGQWVTTRNLNWESLPARVEATVAQRIERLPDPVRQALAVASVEGESFNAEIIARIQATTERDTVRLLSEELERKHQLVEAQGIQRLNGQRLSRYRFRHVLFQTYLYHNLDEVERAQLHEEIGLLLETLYRGRTAEIALALARHFAAAGITTKAVQYLHQAGTQALRLSANEEAIAHFRRGLALLETQSDRPERAQQELALQTGLGVAFGAARGDAAPETGQAYARARALCQQVGETASLFQVMQGQRRFHHVRAELQTARALEEQLLALADQAQDAALLLDAHGVLGATLYYQGEFVLARKHLEHCLSLYQPAPQPKKAF